MSKAVARLWNLQQRIRRLASAMKNMSTHGVCRPSDLQGLTEDQVKEYGKGHLLGPVLDPMGKRCGNPPSQEAAATLVKHISHFTSHLTPFILSNEPYTQL